LACPENVEGSARTVLTMRGVLFLRSIPTLWQAGVAEKRPLRRHSREGGNPRCAAMLDSPRHSLPVLRLSKGGNDASAFEEICFSEGKVNGARHRIT
jgi:hypothetical protein